VKGSEVESVDVWVWMMDPESEGDACVKVVG
jgi:hypothetical protein